MKERLLRHYAEVCFQIKLNVFNGESSYKSHLNPELALCLGNLCFKFLGFFLTLSLSTDTVQIFEQALSIVSLCYTLQHHTHVFYFSVNNHCSIEIDPELMGLLNVHAKHLQTPHCEPAWRQLRDTRATPFPHHGVCDLCLVQLDKHMSWRILVCTVGVNSCVNSRVYSALRAQIHDFYLKFLPVS